MLDQSVIDSLLFATAVVGLIWVLVPPLMFALGFTRVKFVVNDDPASAEPTADDPDYARRYRQFLQLGFQPVGTVDETVWFMNPMKWFRRSLRPGPWLAAVDGKSFATFHRLIPSEPVRFGVVTLTSDGGHLRTACPGVGDTRVDGNYVKITLQNVEPDELVARHEEHVEVFCRQHDSKVQRATFLEAVAVEEEHTRKLLPKIGGGSQYQMPHIFFLFPAMAVVGYSSRLGYHFDDWHIWAVAACCGAAVFAVFKYLLLPAMVQQAAERHRAGRSSSRGS